MGARCHWNQAGGARVAQRRNRAPPRSARLLRSYAPSHRALMGGMRDREMGGTGGQRKPRRD
eukprot:200161-Pyramimonas_sp.AAC.1